jgi:hypothetical protein
VLADGFGGALREVEQQLLLSAEDAAQERGMARTT